VCLQGQWKTLSGRHGMAHVVLIRPVAMWHPWSGVPVHEWTGKLGSSSSSLWKHLSRVEQLLSGRT
jgi:hypothetical protein